MLDLRIPPFRLRHDGLQWAVTETKVAKEGSKDAGKERDADPSYFGRLSHALLDVFDRLAGREGAESIDALQRAVQTHARAILEAAADIDRQLLAARTGD